MGRRDQISNNDLQFGDVVLIKNFGINPLRLAAIGPCIFMEYLNDHKKFALVYHTKSKRIRRINIKHISPIKQV